VSSKILTLHDASALADARIPSSSPWASVHKIVAAVGLLGLLACAYGAMNDPTRFAYSYLFAFVVVLSVALGALFFVLIQHLTGSGWSVTVRRCAEVMMGGLPVFLVLVIPILVSVPRLYPWAGAQREVEPTQAGAFGNSMDEGEREPLALAASNRGISRDLDIARSTEEAQVLEGRRPFMNRSFFTLRALAYLGIWAMTAWRLLSWSTRQDKDRTLAGTKAAQRLAPKAMAAFAVTLALASFDWLMSLEPLWYSTIFGVYIFAGCAVAGVAFLILLLRLLQGTGYLQEAVTIEHYHDLGKLLFGWLSFWSYIAFVQFFLIWYANVPEEVSFFHRRWTDNLGTWKPVSLALVVLHFAVPFWVLLSRNAKRHPLVLGLAATLIVVLHAMDIYWLVLPHVGPFAPEWIDVACLVGIGGVYGAAVLWALQGRSLVCIGDPRLDRALVSESG